MTHARSDAFSTPWDAPLVPHFPFTMRDVTILTMLYRTDTDAVAHLIPEPLVAASDLVAVHLYQMNDTEWFGRYNESAVQVQVALPGSNETGAYSPYLFLDNDGAIAAGREVYGQPKKYGKPKIDIRQDLIVGTLERNGIEVLSVTTPYKQRRSEISEVLSEFDFITNINYKVVPSTTGGTAVRELTARQLLDVSVDECWVGPGTVEIRPNAQAPIYRLPVRETLAAYYWHCDFTLGPARVIHDYLASSDPASPASAS